MSSLEKQAADRKERLAALRGLKRKHTDDGSTSTSENVSRTDSQTSGDDTSASNVFKPRNFDPINRAPKMGFTEPPVEVSENETIEVVSDKIQQQSLEDLSKKMSLDNGLDLKALQPKRANWDLKRDLEPKLQILEQRTNSAITKAVRERILKAQAQSQSRTNDDVISETA